MRKSTIQIYNLTALPPELHLNMQWPRLKEHNIACRYLHEALIGYGAVAVVGHTVVAFWITEKPCVRAIDGRLEIASKITYVSRRYRRAGLAQRLWDAHIDFWKPQVVVACIGSTAGRAYLKHAVLRYARRGVLIFVESPTTMGGPCNAGVYAEIVMDLVKPQPKQRPRRKAAVRPEGKSCH